MPHKSIVVCLLVISINFLSAENSDTIRYQFQPVTITSNRATESWIEAPIAFDVVPLGENFSGKGYGLDEAISGIPGVFVQSRYGNQDVRLTIRGFGARGAGAKSNAGTSRGIRILLDGFPETEPDGRTSMDLIDISSAERIEVVRSNASALWGNASGGLVNVLSHSSFDRPYTSVQSLFGSFGFRKELIQAGAQLDDGRFFISLGGTNFDGWRKHSGSAQTLLNTGIVSDIGKKTSLGIYLTATTNLFRIPGPMTKEQYETAPDQADSLFIVRDERRFNRLGRLGVSVSHEIGLGQTISASVFANIKNLQRSERNTFRDFNRYHIGGNAVYRNNFFVSNTINSVFLAGADEAYQDGALLFYSLTASGGRGKSLKSNRREGANNFGVFAQNELFISDVVSATTGLRYDRINYYNDDNISPQLNDQKTFEHLTPKIGVTYRFASAHSVYANLGGGLEVPAGNEVDPPYSAADGRLDTVRALNPLLEPITSTSFEIGTKQAISLNDGCIKGLLMYDAALYWLEVRNDIIPYDNGTFYFTAGRTRRMGIETSVKLQLENGLSVEPSLTITDNTYLDYFVDSVHFDKPGKYLDLKNKKMAGLPSFFYSAGFRYSPPLFDVSYIKITVQGTGKYFADDRNLYDVPSNILFNVSLGIENFTIPNSTWFIRAFAGINNAAGSKYVSSVWINPQLDANGRPVYIEPGPPRNFTGSVLIGKYL